MNTRGKKDERGISAVEYGLMIALCVMLFIGALNLTFGAFFEKCAAPVVEKGYVDASAGETCG